MNVKETIKNDKKLTAACERYKKAVDAKKEAIKRCDEDIASASNAIDARIAELFSDKIGKFVQIINLDGKPSVRKGFLIGFESKPLNCIETFQKFYPILAMAKKDGTPSKKRYNWFDVLSLDQISAIEEVRSDADNS